MPGDDYWHEGEVGWDVCGVCVVVVCVVCVVCGVCGMCVVWGVWGVCAELLIMCRTSYCLTTPTKLSSYVITYPMQL